MSTRTSAIPDVLDASTEAGQRAARRRWWFLATVFVIAPIGLVLAAVLAFVGWLYGEHAAALAKVRAEVARIQAAGEPITTDDLYARGHVPAGVNDTTRLWLAALGSLDETKFNADAKSLPIVGESSGPDLLPADVAKAELLLANYDATVQATLAAAAADGECRLFVEFNDGFAALLPNAQKMRTLSRMMALRTRVAAAQGDNEQAVQSVEAMFEASRTLAQQQLLIEHLVRLATAGVALRETEFLLNELELTDEQLARLRKKVEALDFQQSLVASCMGERSMGYHMFRHPEQFDMAQGDFTKQAGTGPGNVTRGADCLLYLELQRDMIAAAREPFPGAIDQADLVEQRLKVLAGTKNPLEKFNHMFTLLIMPATSGSFQATGRNLAQRDLVLAAIAAGQFEQKNGKLPESLESLVPEFLPTVPTDPFDGQPLRFKATDEGLVLYSIGRDRKDDGGVDPEHKSEPDVVVRLK
jgi:hypothetical protein